MQTKAYLNIPRQLKNTNMAEEDYTKGDIYMVTSKTTGLSYIGAAKKYMGENLQKWGTHGRWVRHVLDSGKESRAEYNSVFHTAIRELGKDDFEVKTIDECLIEELDEKETYYIKHYNTLHPNGYNMTEGGRNGKRCDEFKEKAKKEKKPMSEQGKKNISQAGIGRRAENTAERKNDADKDLPRYITSIRLDGTLLGYKVKKFPIGIEKAEYVEKTFKNKANPAAALEKAKTFLEQCKKEYDEKLAHYNEQKQRKEAEDTEAKKKAEEEKNALPDNIYEVKLKDIVTGYFVDGLSDFNGNPIPKREFTGNTNNTNMSRAMKFVQLVKTMNEKKETPSDWLTVELPKNQRDPDMPKHIRKNTYFGKDNGYRVDYPIGFKNNKPVFESKTFTDKNMTMEEKLQLAKEFVEEMNKKHAASTSSS